MATDFSQLNQLSPQNLAALLQLLQSGAQGQQGVSSSQNGPGQQFAGLPGIDAFQGSGPSSTGYGGGLGGGLSGLGAPGGLSAPGGYAMAPGMGAYPAPTTQFDYTGKIGNIGRVIAEVAKLAVPPPVKLALSLALMAQEKYGMGIPTADRNPTMAGLNKVFGALPGVGLATEISGLFTGRPDNMPEQPAPPQDLAKSLQLTVSRMRDPLTTTQPGKIGDLMNYNPQSVQPDPALGLTVQDFNNFVDTYQPYSFDFSQDFAGLAGQSEGDTTPGAPDPNDPSQNSLSLEVSIMDPSFGLVDEPSTGESSSTGATGESDTSDDTGGGSAGSGDGGEF